MYMYTFVFVVHSLAPPVLMSECPWERHRPPKFFVVIRLLPHMI